MAAELSVHTHRDGNGHLTLTAAGELDLSTIGRFGEALQEAVAEAAPGASTNLDLAAVEYLDSAAINVLFANAERIGLVVVHPLLLRGLVISGLDQVVEVRAAAP